MTPPRSSCGDSRFASRNNRFLFFLDCSPCFLTSATVKYPGLRRIAPGYVLELIVRG